MSREVRISAFVDATTRALLDRHAHTTGVKKGHLVEEALRHYLQTLQELPLDVIVRSTLVLTSASGHVVSNAIRRGKPSEALADLMQHRDWGASGGRRSRPLPVR